jgi:hypothetical protein
VTRPKFVQLFKCRSEHGSGYWIYGLDSEGRVWSQTFYMKDGQPAYRWRLLPQEFVDLTSGEVLNA